MTILLIVLITIYYISLVYITDKFAKIPQVTIDKALELSCEFSIIVPYRNEFSNLQILLESLRKIEYPADKVEIIFCDDHSSDDGFILLQTASESFGFQIGFAFNSSREIGKKAALNKGIQKARFEYIITTDADCTVNPYWLQALNSRICETEAELIVGPVIYENQGTNTILSQYQIIENAGLICIGAAGISDSKPFIANGANLCFRKESYMKVDGFDGNYHIPSGDDEFLLQKFAKSFPDGIYFLKNNEALVSTPVQIGFSAFLNQRVRWAAKARKHKNKQVFAWQIAIALIYLSILINLFTAPFPSSILPVLLKIASDIYFYLRIRNFFNFRHTYLTIALTSFLQVVIVPLVGIYALIGKFSWKERKYKI